MPMNQEFRLERNRKMFRFNFIFGLSLIAISVLAGKELKFAIFLSIFTFFFIITNYWLTFKLSQYPSLPAYHNMVSYFLCWFYIVLSDPSLNKFLFVFAFIVFSVLYQNSKIALLIGALSVASVFYLYFNYKDEIYGGYDVVEIKSLLFTLFVLVMINLIVVIQTRHAARSFQTITDQSENEQALRKKTEEFVKTLQAQASEIEHFQEMLTQKVDQTKDVTDNGYMLLSHLNSAFSKQNELLDTNKHIIYSFIEEFNKIHDSAQDLLQLNANSRDIVDVSTQKVGQLKDSTASLKDTFHQTVDTSQKLSRNTNDIEKMIATIQDIAEQTNMLALNASIESARAGVHGKGFSVVAGEVKKLAVTSSKSAHDINELLKEIQYDTKNHEQDIMDSYHLLLENEQAITTIEELFTRLQGNVENNRDFLTLISEKFIKLQAIITNVTENAQVSSSLNEDTQTSLSDVNQSFDEIRSYIESIHDDFRELSNTLQQK